MKKRFYLSLAICLGLLLVGNPLLAVSSTAKSKTRTPVASAERKTNTVGTVTPGGKGSAERGNRGIRQATPTGQSDTLLPDGRLLLIGGEGADGPVATAVIRDSRTDELTPLSNRLLHERAWHTATLLPDGGVLILGGVDAKGNAVEGAEMFDPETQTFEALPFTGLIPRFHHTATLLTEGQVLIAGGLSRTGRLVRRVELWDPQSRAAARPLRARLKTGRYSHKAALVADGSVFWSGGIGRSGTPIEDGEVYVADSRRVESVRAASVQLEGDELRLEASLPVDGATGVPVNSPISLRFSKHLRVDTVSTSTVALFGPNGPVITKVIPAERGLLAFITPKESLSRGTDYTLSLSGPADGNGFALPLTQISFRTAGRPTPPVIAPFDGEEWVPDEKNIQGNWRSGRLDSSWRSLPSLQAAPGVTALAGQALTLNGQPLDNVTLKIKDKTVQTDSTGRFLLTEIPPGHQELLIDGRTASRPGKTYGVFEAGVNVSGQKTTSLSYTIWMPKIDTVHKVTIPSPTRAEVVVTTPRIPGLEVRIPPQTTIRDTDGNVVTEISITPIPLDRTPFPLPQGVDVPIYFTVQPGGAYIHTYGSTGPKGARLIYPNYKNRPAGTSFNFWHYDPEERGWYVYGQGTVAEDGRQVVPDSNVAIYEFTGAMVAPPDMVPPEGPEDCNKDGDPVNLGTGLFVLDKTDLILPDVLPIVLRRTYRQRDTFSRAFGIGASHSFDLFLAGTSSPYTYVDVVLPDGGRIHYDRISPGTGFEDAVYENTSSPTGFYKSRIAWNGNGFTLTLKDGTLLRFRERAFGEVGRPGQSGLLSVTDRYGNTLSITRNSSGNIGQIVSSNGRWLQFTHDASNRVIQVQDNIGRTVNYTYDAGGRLWKVTDPADGVTEYTYNASNQMLTIKDARGIVFLTNEYDANGRVKKQTQADSTTYQFAYTLDGNGKVTRTDVADPRGNIRTVTFSSTGHALTDTRGCCGGLAHTFERQAGTNFVLSDTDPLNRRTEYSYDALGNVMSITRLAGTTEAVTTSYTYEPTFNQIATVTDPLNHTTQFGYDSKGNLTSVTDPLNHQTTIAYNLAGQPLSVTDPLTNTTQFQYDAGDLTGVINPLGQSFSRFVDAAGRMLSLTNSIGQTARIEYDALNQPTRVSDPLQGATSFGYDPNGNLLSVTDARNKTVSYSYDNMDRIATRTDQLLRQDVYLYDANGNLRQVTDRKNQVTNYDYDSLDRLTLVTYADLSTTSYNYDNVNRLTSVVDSISGTISYGYDNLDRLTSEMTTLGTASPTVNYTYDAAGRRTSMTVITESPAVNYLYFYDSADRLTQVTQGNSTVTIAYDAAGRRTTSEKVQPNNVITQYGYDVASRLTNITYKKDKITLGNLTYDYDAVGRATKLGGSFARTGLPQPVSVTSYNAANQQTSFGTQTLTYDNNGNLTSDGINSYGWNARDQLVSISGPGLSATFLYDAVGRRISKSINAASIAYVYDGANVAQEQVAREASANMLMGGIDELFARTDYPGGTSSTLVDGLGSVLALTDSTGTVQTQYSYEPFGKTTALGASSTNPSQYTGRENDGTGLYYYRARYYSPGLQRFVSEDPIGFDGGDPNFYAYVQNNPTNETDVFGLFPQENIPPQGTLPGTNIPYRMDLRQQPEPNMHVYWRDGTETVITNEGGWLRRHGGRRCAVPPMKYRKPLRKVVKVFLRKAGRMVPVAGAIFWGADIAEAYELSRRKDTGVGDYLNILIPYQDVEHPIVSTGGPIGFTPFLFR